MSADKRLKKAALDNALMALADPTKAAKVDPVSQAFVQYWKQKAVDMEKNKNKVGWLVGCIFCLFLLRVAAECIFCAAALVFFCFCFLTIFLGSLVVVKSR